jgi:natural product biosynthesis luciferase-like monooxygenase protein
LRTGDLGFADGGQLVVTGRIKDLIVIRGRNYYPHDIELVMGEAHEAIRDDRCIAFSLGGLEQEEVAVFFELQRGLHKDLDLGSVMTAVREAISESCALSTCVIGVVEDGALPRTSSGKVRRSSCREAFLANELPLLAMEGENPAQDQPVAAPPETADPDVPDLEEVQACLVREISQIIGHSVDADAIITRIGINSVDAIDIMFEIEDRFGLAIDPESLNDSISIAELARRAVAGVSSEQAVVVTTPPGTASEVPVVHARPLDVSLMYFSTDTLDSDARLDLLLEGAKFADQHDFAAVWIPERHFHPFGGTYPNPSVAAAALAVITKNVRLRAGSVVVPLHNPVRIAEEWALVDNLSKGRVDLAFATGWNPDDFALAPRSFDNRRAITMASIKEVQRLWSGEPTILVNGNGTSVPISIYPRPIQSQFGSWLTCTSSIDGFVEAGKLGYNVLTALLFQRTEDLSEKITAYRQAREQHGHDPETGRVTLMLHTFVGPTEETVHEVVKPAFKRYLASSADAWKGEWSDLVGDDGAPSDKLLELAYQRYTHGNSLIGTPADCASHATRLQDLGVDEVACLIDFGVEPSVTLEALNHLNEMRLLCKAETDRRIAAD